MQQGNINNTANLMTWMVKIFGILGMVFIGISLALPWAGYTIPYSTYGLSMNAWGVSTNIPSTGLAYEKYLSDPFYINAMQSGITEGMVAGVFMILVFIFTIITLLFSIKAFRSIGKTSGVNKNYLITGILTIVTIVLCAIAVSQGTAYGNSIYYMVAGTTIAGGFGFSWAFILAIIALVFFFINYGIDYYMLQSGTRLQVTSFGQQPQAMYTSQQPPVQQPPIQQTPPVQPETQTTKKPKQTAQTGPNFCNSCGAHLEPGVKFCSKCGAKI